MSKWTLADPSQLGELGTSNAGSKTEASAAAVGAAAQQLENLLNGIDTPVNNGFENAGSDSFRDTGFGDFSEPVTTPATPAYAPPPSSPFQTQFASTGLQSKEDEALNTLLSWCDHTAIYGLQAAIGTISTYKSEVNDALGAIRKYHAKLIGAKVQAKLTEYVLELKKYEINCDTFSMNYKNLAGRRSEFDAIPNLLEVVKNNSDYYRQNGRDADVNKVLNQRLNPTPASSATQGILGLYHHFCSEHAGVVLLWQEYAKSLEECKQAIEISKKKVQYTEEIRQPISAQAQANATMAFSHFGTGSSRGMFVGLDELNKILYSAIDDYTGNNLSLIKTFAINDDGDIILNGKSFIIGDYVKLDEGDAVKLPEVYRSQLENGKWGCIMDFGKLYRFSNLQVLDISQAPARKLDIVKELGINKGKWTQLFKRKSKFPNLQEIRLPPPEGIITRNAGIAQTFKSNAEYERFSNEHYATANKGGNGQTIDEHNAVALQGMGSRVLGTFKDKLWSKPLPRLLMKTFGYGVGVPMYWGLMTALGPFAVVMGVLGVGAMAHYEYKNFKSTGSF